jgi:hypothetical protein
VSRLALVAVLVAACNGDDDGFSYQGEPITVDTDYGDEVPAIPIAVDDVASPFLVDTGAPFTVLNLPSFQDAVDDEGLYRADLNLWGIDVRDYVVVVTTVFDPGSSITGLLGGDFLRHFALALDYRAETSTLWDPYVPVDGEIALSFDLLGGGLSYVPCSQSLQCGTFRVPETRITMRAFFEGGAQDFNVVLDTGASAIVLDDGFYDLLDAATPGRPRLDGIDVDTVEGLLPGFLSRVSRISLVGDEEDDPAAVLDDVPILVIPGNQLLAGLSQEVGRPVVALVGGTFFRMHHTVIDYPERRLRLQRYDTTPHVPDDEFVQVGLEITRAGEEWVVARVYAGTDAEAELIVEGDVIETIEGTEVSALPGEDVAVLVFFHSLGDEVRFGLRRPPSDVVEEKLVTVEDLLPSFPPP